MFSLDRVLTEEQIEHKVELAMDRLDRHLLSNQISQDQYDFDVLAMAAWAFEQYRRLKEMQTLSI